jgi:DNA-binding winged helix-turn-helix (wHTH) protein/Tfp pilus assembly protein PilF
MPAGGDFAFGPFRLDTHAKRLLRSGEPVVLSPRHFDLLRAFVGRPGDVLSKNDLIQIVWQDVAVTDSSLVKIVGELRDLLDPTDATRYIQTVARRGYHFVAPVTRNSTRRTDADLDDVLAPHRAFIDGCAALETLERSEIVRARSTFEQLLERDVTKATVHVGLANACVLAFEATRADPSPDRDTLLLAVTHAREACRLDPGSGEAWATLGFVLERTGQRLDALAALRQGVTLDPRNWRHQLRLAYGSWGEERLQAARRTLDLLPDCPMAHWLAATVYVAREALTQAERELDAGIAGLPGESSAPARFSTVALHWLEGLLCLARGADDEALESFGRELAGEARGQLYARECCANTWYAMGACHVRRGDEPSARAAFEQAIARVPLHPMAHVGLALLEPNRRGDSPPVAPASLESALARAAVLVGDGDAPGAAQRVAAALTSAPPGNTGWLLPIEPLLGIQRDRATWTAVLAMLRARAA